MGAAAGVRSVGRSKERGITQAGSRTLTGRRTLKSTAASAASADGTAPSTDGRRAKGELRRRALIEATVRVIARDGAGGVTHRTVAKEAGLPTTATTYYFDSIDALLTAALTSCMEEDSARIERLAEEPGDAAERLRTLAGLMAELLTAPGHLLAEFEMYLLAARRPEQRAATRRWQEALAAFARQLTDDPVRVKLFARAYDGLLLQGLLADEPPTAGEFEEMLRELLLPPG